MQLMDICCVGFTVIALSSYFQLIFVRHKRLVKLEISTAISTLKRFKFRSFDATFYNKFFGMSWIWVYIYP